MGRIKKPINDSVLANWLEEEFKNDDDFIGFTIKFLRSDLRHDLEHGNEKDIRKKRVLLANLYRKYSGKTSINSMRKTF
jgi:hypothetical protein